MIYFYKGSSQTGENEILIRKSRRLLFFIIIRMGLLFSIVFVLGYFMFYFQNYFTENYQLGFILGIIVISLFLYFLFGLVVRLVRYFFDVFVVNQGKIIKIKIGLFLTEKVEIIELYRVQEIKADCDNFFFGLFDVGHISLVEQKDTEKIIHWIDNPRKIAFMIQEMKEETIRGRGGNGED